MCKGAVASNSPGAGDLSTGFAWSIYFMLSMPFLLLGGFITFFYFKIRSARKAQSSQEESSKG